MLRCTSKSNLIFPVVFMWSFHVRLSSKCAPKDFMLAFLCNSTLHILSIGRARSRLSFWLFFLGNKAEGWISKRVFQENKARQIFRITNIFYPLIHTRACAYQGVKNVHDVKNVPYLENLTCFVFLKHLLRDSPFGLITDVLWDRKNTDFFALSDNLFALSHSFIFLQI